MKRFLRAGIFFAVLFFIGMGGVKGSGMEVKAKSLPVEFFDGNWYYFKHHRENAEIASMRTDYNGLKNHYYTKGIALGYSPSVAFDPKEYLKFNVDLSKAFGNNMTEAYNHFLEHVLYGSEQRITSQFFRVDYYAKTMAKEMPGASNWKLYEHYCRFGAYEGRLASDTNASKALSRMFHFQSYYKYNEDVKKAFSKDEDDGRRSAFGHFLMCTVADGEGRRSMDDFQISYYAKKVGKSCEDAFWYYINSGYRGSNDDTIQSYTITYNANGGSGAPAAQKKIIGINLALSSTKPTRTGYTFQGWAASAEAAAANSSYAPGKTYTGNANLALYAVWKINTYAVTYNLNGGTSAAIASQAKVHDVDLTLTTAIPTRENYGFAGWATAANASSVSYTSGGTYKANAPVTLYAVWKLNQYTVGYDANGGSGAPAEQVKTHGETLTLSDTKPTRTGYDFMGWATSADAEEVVYAPGNSYAANATVHLFAVWRIRTYTVKYDVNGGDSSISIPEQIKTYGKDLVLSNAEPTRANYGFAGWALSKDAKAALYHPGAAYKTEGDVTLYAVWKKDVYRVIYSANADGADSSVTGMPESFEREAGEEIQVSPAIPAREGYTFLGWGRIMEGGFVKQYKAGESFNENSTLILYAAWEINTYPVTYYNMDENGDYGQWRAQVKTYGEDLHLADTAPSKAGYDFKGWAVSASASSVKYKAGDIYQENKKLDLYAVWELKKYTVSYDANGGASAPADQVKKHGEPLKLTISTPYCLGYTFCGWSTRASDKKAEYEAGQEYTKEANLKLYAVWEKITYTVGYDANGGYFLDAPPAEKKEWGTTLKLTDQVPLKPGYDFAGWSADKEASLASYQAGGSYTNNEDAVLYAVWKVSECTITYDANGGTGAPSPQKKAYNEASKLSTFTPVRTGYDFIGWGRTPEDSGAAYLPGDLYTDNTSVVLYALWKVKSYTVSYDANGGVFISSIRDDVKYYGTALKLSNVKPVKDGYDFMGWSESSSAKTASYEPGGLFTADRDAVLYAVWGHKTAENGGGGTGQGDAGTHTGDTAKPAQSIQTAKSVYKVAYGAKPFSLNAKAINGGTLTFRSDNPKVAKVNKNGKVTVKGCGAAKITITAGVSGQAVKKTVQVQVVPKKQGIKVKYNKSLRKLRVEWNKDGKASGYMVWISKSSKFAKKDTRQYPYGKSVYGRIYSGLKKGTYYIKVRSYVKAGKKKYYGGWSGTQKVKVS